MSPIKKTTMPVLFLCIVILAITGCGDPNAKAVFSADTGSHPAGWLHVTHASAARADQGSCAECHGDDLSGGIARVSCLQCHLNGSPLELTGCTSCHQDPPEGTTAPNRTGAHAAHNSLPNVAGVCDTCHSGAGATTEAHDNGTVDVRFLSAYNAKSGPAIRNADGTCSKVSCHGGKTTPAWLSGTAIDVNTQCTACHSYGTTEYNSFVSGQHGFHAVTAGYPCDYCHDASKLAPGHFSALNTQTMEGLASATINGIKIIDYSNGSCTTTCHGTRSWY